MSSIKKLYRTKLEESFPDTVKLVIGDDEIEYVKAQSLRYGENPHQPAAFYAPTEGALTVGAMKILKTGKGGLSQTNIQDMNNALNIVRYFDEPVCAVMKHVNPSGVAAAREETASGRYSSARGTVTVWRHSAESSASTAWSTQRRRARCSRATSRP